MLDKIFAEVFVPVTLSRDEAVQMYHNVVSTLAANGMYQAPEMGRRSGFFGLDFESYDSVECGEIRVTSNPATGAEEHYLQIYLHQIGNGYPYQFVKTDGGYSNAYIVRPLSQ